MSWWGWMVIGAVLLGAELFVVEAEFYLVFIGIAAVLTGLGVLVVPSLPLWAHWLVFAGLAITSMIFFRRRVYGALRSAPLGLKPDLVGDILRVPASLAPGDTCRVEIRGTTWTAVNAGRSSLEAGEKATILAVDGVILRIAAA